MHDPLIAQHLDRAAGARSGAVPARSRAALPWSALPDAPVVRVAQVAPPTWRVALAALLRRGAARLDRPATVPAPAC